MQKEHQEEVKKERDGTAKKPEPQKGKPETTEGEGASVEKEATDDKDKKEPTESGIYYCWKVVYEHMLTA